MFIAVRHGMMQSEVKMKVIGLTGGTGSGKSVVASVFMEKNAYIIDADQIGHDIILKGKPAYNEIVNYFGRKILDNDNNINRKKLGEIVFSNSEKLKYLNKCTHDYIKQEIINQIDIAKKGSYIAIIIDAALLYEANLTDICDEVIVVTAKEDIRIKRIISRDGITEELAKKRISSQMSDSQYIDLGSIVIDNSLDIEHVRKQIELIKF